MLDGLSEYGYWIVARFFSRQRAHSALKSFLPSPQRRKWIFGLYLVCHNRKCAGRHLLQQSKTGKTNGSKNISR